MQKDTQKGTASIEAAIGLLVLVPLLMVLVEGTYALNEYSKILDASREGARMALREEGDASQVEQLVKNLTEELPGASPNVDVTVDAVDPDHKTVTVQVEYGYEPHLVPKSADNKGSVWGLLGHDLTMVAATTMPLP